MGKDKDKQFVSLGRYRLGFEVIEGTPARTNVIREDLLGRWPKGYSFLIYGVQGKPIFHGPWFESKAEAKHCAQEALERVSNQLRARGVAVRPA